MHDRVLTCEFDAARNVFCERGMITFMSAPPKTLDDLYALGDDVRAELIDGEILPKAVPRYEHSHAEFKFGTWFGRRFDRPPGGRWPGGWLFANEIHCIYDRANVFCHDVAGWRRERVTEPLKGWVELRPDWVCEILSPGHEKRDVIDKLDVLRIAEVPHYWIVDHAKHKLLVYTLSPDGYVARTIPAGAVVRLAPFDAVDLRTAVLFGDEPDEE